MTPFSSTRLAVNVAVLDDANRVLLTRREDFEVWCLPGGMVDEGESIAAAATREVTEETGLVVQLTGLVGVYSRPNFGEYHTLAVFSAAPVGGSLRPDPDEVVEAQWFAEAELPPDLLWGQRERLADTFNGAGGSIVRSLDLTRPANWPRDRREQYAIRDRSGLPRATFYAQIFDALGDGTSVIEVDGTRTDSRREEH